MGCITPPVCPRPMGRYRTIITTYLSFVVCATGLCSAWKVSVTVCSCSVLRHAANCCSSRSVFCVNVCTRGVRCWSGVNSHSEAVRSPHLFPHLCPQLDLTFVSPPGGGAGPRRWARRLSGGEGWEDAQLHIHRY